MTQQRSSGGYRGGGAGGAGGRRGGRRYFTRRKVCQFCVRHVTHISYKEVPVLRTFVSDRFKIESRRKTGVCSKHQRGLATAIKRARHLAMIPYSSAHRFSGTGSLR